MATEAEILVVGSMGLEAMAAEFEGMMVDTAVMGVLTGGQGYLPNPEHTQYG